MSPHDALAAGDLDAAIRTVRAVAVGGASQLHLAELLGVAGDTAEALAVLNAIESAAPDWPATRRRFARTLRAAARRRGGVRTRLAEAEPPHLRHRWRAVRLQSVDPGRGLRHVDRADALAPELAGHADGREFLGLRDADDAFGSVLELLAGGRWCWVAWESLVRVRLAPAVGTLDLAFRPAELTFRDGRALAATLPLIYPHAGEVEGVFKLGLETDFDSAGGGPVRGVGARLLRLGDDEVPLAELRQLDLRPA